MTIQGIQGGGELPFEALILPKPFKIRKHILADLPQNDQLKSASVVYFGFIEPDEERKAEMAYEDIEKTMKRALAEAGKLVKNSLFERNVVAKKSDLSLVTATDTAAEKIVIDIIHEDFPDHAILSEECLAKGESIHRWIIDPIDGTTNFAHTYPVACVSIAYEKEGVVEVGGVYDPFRDELFFSVRGQGSTLNGETISVSAIETLEESLVCTGFPYNRREDPMSYLNPMHDFIMKAHGIRRSGSAALDLCWIACGRLDGYWEPVLNPWDCAAAGLIAQEAGGTITNFAGDPYHINGIQALASNGKIHAEMLEVLKPYQKVGLPKD